MLELWWLQFKDWMLEPLHKAIVILIGICLFLATGLYTFNLVKTYADANSLSKRIVNEQATNNKYFSLLLSKQTKEDDGTYTLTYDLFMKQPFQNSQLLNTHLQEFIDSVKKQYNVGGQKKVRAIGIRLYDRKIVWDMGLTPRGTAMYALDQDYAQKLGEKQDAKDKNAVESSDGLGNTTKITDNTVMSTTEQAWKQTRDTDNKIDYDKYALATFGIQTYSRSQVSKPLSDQEFAFWLKMKEYEALIGSNNIQSAVQLYVNYDLNGRTDKDHFLIISKEFEDLDKRETAIGNNTQYFPNSVLLRRQAAIYRPQLLYMIISNGDNVKSYTEAQKKIIKIDPDQYSDIIKQHAKEIADSADSYGNIDFYSKKVNGQTVNADPFVNLTGKANKKRFPTFERPAFSPVPVANNALYPQTFVSGVSGQDLN